MADSFFLAFYSKENMDEPFVRNEYEQFLLNGCQEQQCSRSIYTHGDSVPPLGHQMLC